MRDHRPPPAAGQTKRWNAQAYPVNCQPAQCEQVSLTWNLDQAGSYSYQLVDQQTGRITNLTPGGNYICQLCDQQNLSFELRTREGGFATGDLDGDGDVDLAHGGVLFAAFSGDGVPTANLAGDLDGDTDCDLNDYTILAANFTGPMS